jgi:hypothetical protein
VAIALPILNARMPLSVAGRPLSSLPGLARLNLRYLAAHGAECVVDHWYGINTRASWRGAESLAALTTLGGKIDAHPYEGTPFGTIKSVLARLPRDVSNYSFVDYGSGKGRVILMASRRRFRQVIGVEFAEPLHRLAEINISRFRGKSISPVKSVLSRAETFVIPDGPCILYFFNPFEAAVADEVVRSVISSCSAKPRHIMIVLYHPMLLHAFVTKDCFRHRSTITESSLSSLGHPTRYVIRILETN